MTFLGKKLIWVVALGLVLGACSTETGKKENSKSRAGETLVETIEPVETEQRSIVADEMTTIFYPEVTRLRHLTEEDLRWYDIIITRLNAIDDFSGDRDTVYKIAEEYGEDPEKLWFDWLEIWDAKWHGDNGNYAILSDDYNKLMIEIIEKNIIGENIEYTSSGYETDEENVTSSGYLNLCVNEQPYEITYILAHRDDFKIAEIIEFSIDGEKIDL